jgi:hypothetical protein
MTVIVPMRAAACKGECAHVDNVVAVVARCRADPDLRFTRLESGVSFRWARAQLAVAVLVSLAVVAAAVEVWRAVSDLQAAATHAESLSFADRDVAAGNSILPDQQLAYAARAWIPRNGRYRVVLGDGAIPHETPLTRPDALVFLRYFLLPRLPSATAGWVVCLGCDRHGLGAFELVWDDGQGSSLLRLRR